MPITLYIVRHGHAEMRAPTDAQRPLSSAGEKEAAIAASHLMGIKPEVFLASPYIRAQQTANIIQNCASISTLITTEEGITPDDDPKAVASILDSFGSDKCILMVSHNPLVSALVSLLVDGDYHGPYAMATASVACIEFEVFGAGLGTLKWLKHTN